MRHPLMNARTFENLGNLEILDATKLGKQAMALETPNLRVSRMPDDMGDSLVDRRSRMPKN